MRVSPVVCVLLFTMLLSMSLQSAELINPGFEQKDDRGRLAGWTVHTGLDAPSFGVIVPTQRAGGRAGSSACAGFPAEGSQRIEAHEHKQGSVPKAALSQTITVEPGTYAVAAHFRTASGDRWSGGFSLGISTDDKLPASIADDMKGKWLRDTVAVRGIGSHPRQWGEWQRHESPALKVDRKTDVTVWILFHYVNTSGMSACWEVDDVELVKEPGGQVSFRSPFQWEPRVHIYDPSVSPDERWYINDHCFVKDDDGKWHMFGITHAEPLNPLDEKEFAHATADSLMQTPWKKHPPAFRVNEQGGEKHLWAPHVIRRDDTWYMFYCAGGTDSENYQTNLRTSKDLWNWEWHDGNPLFTDIGDARDPMVLEEDGLYRMYYCRPTPAPWGFGATYMRTSRDLFNWSEPECVFVSADRVMCARNVESPFVVKRGNDYLLFVCGDGYTYTKVYWSDRPDSFHLRNFVTSLDAHAAEVIEDKGDIYFSHCGWGMGGVYLHKGRQIADSLKPANLCTSTLHVQIADRWNTPDNVVAVYFHDGSEKHLVDMTEPGKSPGRRARFPLAPASYEVVVMNAKEMLASRRIEMVHGKSSRIVLN